MENAKGLYIHIPFCAAKCGYCDFHSAPCGTATMDAYCEALLREMKTYKGISIDTLYIGGGTPSLLGAERLSRLLGGINDCFNIHGEATLEANPADDLFEVFAAAKRGGINRISMGVQSGVPEELKALGRRHSREETQEAVEASHRAGIHNLSLDLMLGIPLQTADTLAQSIDFITSLSPQHVSAYILKLEEGTPLFEKRNQLTLPDEEAVADLYLQAAETLETLGYRQYEISNFAKAGSESRHNLKYWHCEEYIGLGASAHGFLDGKRYFYPRDTEGFIKEPKRIPDGEGGSPEERFMLGLRLREGVALSDYPQFDLLKKAELLEKHGLCEIQKGRLSLTKNGFLVSNEIIREFLS